MATNNPPATKKTLEHVLLPIALDAFVLNEPVCDTGESFITPIVQPNYVSLRLDDSQIQHDVLPRIDLHTARPALTNPRVSKVSATPFRVLKPTDPAPAPQPQQFVDRSRLGVYLHWTVPRVYRSGVASAAKQSESATSTDKPPDQPTNPNPVFPLVPNRWLLVRILRDFQPTNAIPNRAAAWVIESDKLRKIETLGDDVDLQTDVSPFVAYSGDVDANDDILNNQAEMYIGLKTPLSGWSEPTKPGVVAADRVKLTLMNTSNPLFADFSLHNPNVFSTKDNFRWSGDSKNPQYLTEATCDYFIAGWHSDPDDDPLSAAKNADSPSQLQSRLKNLFCLAQPSSDGKNSTETADTENKARVESALGTRLICHGARYGVKFDLAVKPPTPADTYAKFFDPKKVAMEPASVGTTPLDAVLAFLQAHEKDATFEDDVLKSSSKPTTTVDPKTGTTVTTPTRAGSQIAAGLMGIRELLYLTEDDYDSRVKAADLIFAHNFARAPGGFSWHYDKRKTADGPPMPPSTKPVVDANGVVTQKSETDQLTELNELQQVWDANDRKLTQLRWSLFSEFFKCVSDPSNSSQDVPTQGTSPSGTTPVDRFQLYATRVPLLRGEVKALIDQQTALENRMKARTVDARKVANDPFFRRTDPTLCLAGIDGGWDPMFLNDTQTRFLLDGKVGTPGSDDQTLASQTSGLVTKLLPPDVAPTVATLFKEASGGYQDTLAQFGHKKWTEQPFSPQFVEWEGVYYHIGGDDWRKQWEVELAQSALKASNHTRVTYVNQNQLSALPGVLDDQRHVSGRMLVLPQPSFALGAVVSQVLDTIPVDPKSQASDSSSTTGFNLKNQTDRDAFLSAVKSLKFISGGLAGFTDALLTMATGQHVKPNLRVQGKPPQPMQAAVRAGGKIGLEFQDFVYMDGETGRTPYGTLTNFEAVNRNPFKPVQHGQFAITKIAIVDKFGQAISYPPPQRTPRSVLTGDPVVPDYVHPCIDEQLIPSLSADGSLNTVYTSQQTHDAASSSGYPMTPFIQLTPAINQEARINAMFLEHVLDNAQKPTGWKPCSDWENPIFGWIVVNYADSSLQFFTGEGIFYTALAFGGPKGTIETKKWLPFVPPDESEKRFVSSQLDALIKEMTGTGGRDYLLALWDLIRRAIPTMPFPPSDYAQYANAIVGKPLALVNVGWSLELAQPAYWPQHTLPPPPVIQKGVEIDPLRTEAEKTMSEYSFPVKIGDAERPYDGVLAYWDSENPTPSTDFDNIYTYFPDDEDDGIRTEITPDEYPELQPYFIHPDPLNNINGTGFSKAHVDKLMIKTILMDPYTPIHLYSGILPIKTLQLPQWTLSAAMKNMTAFFTMGPLLITKDVPKVYDKKNELHADSWLTTQNDPIAQKAPPLINLPIAGGKGMWNWLQPYYTTNPDPPTTNPAATPTTNPGATPTTNPGTTPTTNPAATPGATVTAAASDPGSGTLAVTPAGTNTVSQSSDGTKNTYYNALEVGKEDGRIRSDPGPYTFVEGFLQLARPLVVPKQDAIFGGTS